MNVVGFGRYGMVFFLVSRWQQSVPQSPGNSPEVRRSRRRFVDGIREQPAWWMDCISWRFVANDNNDNETKRVCVRLCVDVDVGVGWADSGLVSGGRGAEVGCVGTEGGGVRAVEDFAVHWHEDHPIRRKRTGETYWNIGLSGLSHHHRSSRRSYISG